MGYVKTENAIARHVADEDKTSPLFQGSGSNYKSKTTIINESGLYSLLFAMQPQKAHNNGVSNEYPIETQERINKLRAFKHWVTSEVLPTIRKTGGYVKTGQEDLFLDTYMPKVEVKKVQEHYELYFDGRFMCSCDTNELKSSIAEIYQLYTESITRAC